MSADGVAEDRPTRSVRRWIVGAAGCALLIGLVVAVALRYPSPDAPESPPTSVEPADPAPLQPDVVDPLVELAEVHATSRLQYDECQQDFVEVTGRSAGNRNPFYFC